MFKHYTYEEKARQRIRAMEIKRGLGVRCAAGFLKNNGWSLEGAVALLARA